MALAPQGAVNMALGELGYAFPSNLRARAISLLQSGNPSYTPNAGLPELREAISAYYGKDAHPDQICVCNGAEEAIFILLTALINPGDRIAIPDPDYPAYPAIARMMTAEVIRLKSSCQPDRVDWEQWERQLAGGVKLLLLSNPTNPTGLYLAPDELDKLIEICAKYNVILAMDEIYRELYLQTQPLSAWGLYDKLFVISGLSKSHLMSGWRIGWLLSPPGFSSAIIKTRQYVSTCSNWLSQMLGIFALSKEGMEETAVIRRQLANSQLMAYNALKGYFPELLLPAATPYIMFKVPDDDLQYASALASRGVITVPGSAFGDVARGWIRINHALDPDALTLGLSRIVG